MRRTTHLVTTGVLVAALGLAPRLASAQTGSTSSGSGTTSGSTTGSQATPSDQTGSEQPSTTSPSSTTSTQSPDTTQSASSQSSGGVDPAAARQHLANARQALADLTKLPAATTLQGEQRTAITNFIQAFNAFATAQNDWKSKFQVVDQQLDQILATAGAGGPSADASTGTTGATSTSPNENAAGSSGAATGTGGAAAAAGGYDPSIVEKLKTMRTELDAFLLATGDPEPHIKAIEKILNGGDAAGGGSVGTSGATSASAGGSVTLTPEQVSEIRSHLESMRQAANK